MLTSRLWWERGWNTLIDRTGAQVPPSDLRVRPHPDQVEEDSERGSTEGMEAGR